MSVLTARQRAILRAYGGWILADVLIDPDLGIRQAKQSCYGSSGYRVDGEEFWMNTTARGIELYRFDVDGTRQNRSVLPWSTVARFARALPADLVADIRALRVELTRCTVSHPAFPSKASSDERQRWEHDEYRPWLNRRRAIAARLENAPDVTLADERSQPALFDLDTTVRHRPGPTRISRPAGHRATDMGQGLLL